MSLCADNLAPQRERLRIKRVYTFRRHEDALNHSFDLMVKP
jgi:hypothetical protein